MARPIPPTDDDHDGLPFDRDSASLTAMPTVIDRAIRASLASFTGGLSPMAMADATFSWWIHLLASPGKQMQLVRKALRKAARYQAYVARSLRDGPGAEPAIEPLPQDRRFGDAAWRTPPFNFLHQA